MLAVAIVAAVVPSLLLLWDFHSRDIYREPARVIWAVFFLGIATIPGVLLVALPLKQDMGPDLTFLLFPGPAGTAYAESAPRKVNMSGPAPYPPAPRAPIAGWALLLLGGLLILGGGLLLAILGIGLAADRGRNAAAILVGGAVMGGLPVLLGMIAYRAGLRRLNRRGRASAVAVPGPVHAPRSGSR